MYHLEEKIIILHDAFSRNRRVVKVPKTQLMFIFKTYLKAHLCQFFNVIIKFLFIFKSFYKNMFGPPQLEKVRKKTRLILK